MSAATAALRTKISALDAATARLASATERLTQRNIASGAAAYVRGRDLPKLFSAHVIAGKSDGEIVDLLRRHVAGASRALVTGHWAADGNRLMALRQALRAEEQEDAS